MHTAEEEKSSSDPVSALVSAVSIHSAMAFRKVMFEYKWSLSSFSFVIGLVVWVRTHSSIADRSYVWPSEHITGSTKISIVSGQTKESGHGGICCANNSDPIARRDHGPSQVASYGDRRSRLRPSGARTAPAGREFESDRASDLIHRCTVTELRNGPPGPESGRGARAGAPAGPAPCDGLTATVTAGQPERACPGRLTVSLRAGSDGSHAGTGWYCTPVRRRD